jgi:HlyD family secretion protein
MLRRVNPQFGNAVRLALLPWIAAAIAAAQGGRGPAPVVVAEVTQESVLAAQTFVGTVLPTQRATVGSAVDGRIVECDIEEGDRVAEGQPLAQLLTETIALELETAKSELQYKQAQLAELENGTRPEQLEQARARMAAAKAGREFREGRRERLRSLAEQSNAVTEDEWLEAVAAATEAAELYAEAVAAYEEAKAGPRVELVAQAQAQVDMQQAVVNRLSDQLAKHTIRSRFAGYVVAKHTEVGQWVNRGDPVAEVVGVDQVEVEVQVLEQSVPYVVPGAEVSVNIPALTQSPFSGTVLVAVPQGDLRARTFPVKIRVQNELTNSGPLIKPGMYAKVDLPVGTQQQVVLVPKDAVVLDQRSPMVYVVQGATQQGESGKVAPVPVALGRSHGEKIEISGSLQPGQIVVIEGNERLRPDQDIVIAGRSAAPASAATASSP